MDAQEHGLSFKDLYRALERRHCEAAKQSPAKIPDATTIPQLRHCLWQLTLHSIVYAIKVYVTPLAPKDKDPKAEPPKAKPPITKYLVDPKMVLIRIRFPLILSFAQRRCDRLAVEMLKFVMSSGLVKGSVLKAFGQNRSLQIDHIVVDAERKSQQRASKCFQELIDNRFICKRLPIPEYAIDMRQREEEKKKNKKRSRSSGASSSAASSSSSSSRVTTTTMTTTNTSGGSSATKKRRKRQEASKKAAAAEGQARFDRLITGQDPDALGDGKNIGDDYDDSVFELNVEAICIELKAEDVRLLAGQKVNEIGSKIVEAIWKESKRSVPDLQTFHTAPLPFEDIKNAVVQLGVDRNCFQDYLRMLTAGVPSSFVSSALSNVGTLPSAGIVRKLPKSAKASAETLRDQSEAAQSYRLNVGDMTVFISNLECESIILNRYGGEALRIFRLLKQKNMLEDSQISDLAVVPIQETRKLLCKLSQDGVLSMQQIPKTTDRTPLRTIYCWEASHEQACALFTKQCYQSIKNLKVRLKMIRDEFRPLQRIAYEDNGQELMDAKSKKRYQTLKKAMQIFIKAVIDLDETLMKLNFYSIPNMTRFDPHHDLARLLESRS
eukprot:CAMPEP_0201555502 /NCGR_PEP_ID=MMETSP0173_2-20130828/49406_1 /ASSEMBLY_ACC=CAM_ASM_000268 /TAXON_ID=218659 /ORGANISM="Vexillifera sp., Strain DIVA3 564/2" /LENGTH=607 /DNA_ID=CAMNT_0047967323 /DNA_START=47 /DNA_END=1870 /DNA_ORIENTATION=-